jgi:hypothetical protein
MQGQIQQAEIKAKIAQLRQDFERLSRRCNSFIRISPETIAEYKKQIASLETQLN